MSSNRDRDAEREGSGGIEPLWNRSWMIASAFDWRRENQLEPHLERLRCEQGETALWHFGITCVGRVRSAHELLPQVLSAAADGFESAEERSRLRSAYCGAAGGAYAIGLKHGSENAAAFLAGYRLLDDCPLTAVANAAAFARLSQAYCARTRLLNRLPGEETETPRRRRPRGVPRRSVAVELAALHSVDLEMAREFARRLKRLGGRRTRLVVGRIAAIEAEARAWDEQCGLLECWLDGKEVAR